MYESRALAAAVELRYSITYSNLGRSERLMNDKQYKSTRKKRHKNHHAATQPGPQPDRQTGRTKSHHEITIRLSQNRRTLLHSTKKSSQNHTKTTNHKRTNSPSMNLMHASSCHGDRVSMRRVRSGRHRRRASLRRHRHHETQRAINNATSIVPSSPHGHLKLKTMQNQP